MHKFKTSLGNVVRPQFQNKARVPDDTEVVMPPQILLPRLCQLALLQDRAPQESLAGQGQPSSNATS